MKNNEKNYNITAGPVAQLDRVPDFESEGQEFESLQGHHLISKGNNHEMKLRAKDFFVSITTLYF